MEIGREKMQRNSEEDKGSIIVERKEVRG